MDLLFASDILIESLAMGKTQLNWEKIKLKLVYDGEIHIGMHFPLNLPPFIAFWCANVGPAVFSSPVFHSLHSFNFYNVPADTCLKMVWAYRVRKRKSYIGVKNDNINKDGSLVQLTHLICLHYFIFLWHFLSSSYMWEINFMVIWF